MGEESHRMLQAQNDKGGLADNSSKITLEIILSMWYKISCGILWTAAALLPRSHFRVPASPDSWYQRQIRLLPPPVLLGSEYE